MSDTAIRVESLGKRYRIGKRQASYGTLRESLTETLAAPFKRLRGNGNLSSAPQHLASDDSIWALKDVSFDIKRGEVVGIIGRNGAGKSTLLKVLSRITEPTQGEVDIRGRVGSLLEVGTGFHPELTGRENIYLNGAILGMKKAEIENRFDEIVSFAEVDQFIDTPVKHYSTGMYLRLAFAVAAHLEPEILIVDEVLAVGDAQFQKKCLGKMSEAANGGRTVLFVSHNMTAVRTLCQRAIVLDDGRKAFDSASSDAINFYSMHASTSTDVRWARPQTATFPPLAFETISIFVSGEQPYLKLHCDMQIRCRQQCGRTFVAVDVSDQTFSPIMQALPEALPFIEGIPGIHQIQVEIDLPPLIPGQYHADFWMGSHYTRTLDHVEHALAFEVTAGPSDTRSFPYSPGHGSVAPTCRYTYEVRRL